MPLLPPGAIFHSSASSKFLNCSLVMMSPPDPTRVNAPSLTCQPAGSAAWRYPRHPAPVLPSNSKRQPAARSAFVSVFGTAVLPVTGGDTSGCGGAGGGAVWQLAATSRNAVATDLWMRVVFMQEVLRALAAAPARRGGLARCE